MRITFTESGWNDYLWIQERDRKLLKRINLLIRDASRSPFEGIGKPEPLKADLSGYWSRRITDEHRLVYSGHSKRVNNYCVSVPLRKGLMRNLMNDLTTRV